MRGLSLGGQLLGLTASSQVHLEPVADKERERRIARARETQSALERVQDDPGPESTLRCTGFMPPISEKTAILKAQQRQRPERSMSRPLQRTNERRNRNAALRVRPHRMFETIPHLRDEPVRFRSRLTVHQGGEVDVRAPRLPRPDALVTEVDA